MFMVLILAVVMATVMAGIYAYIGSSSKTEKRSNVRLESTYAAEYAFEQAYQQLNTLINASTQNAPDIAATTGVTNLSVAPTTTFGTADGYTWNAFITVPVENGFPVDSFSNFNPIGGVYKYMTIVEFTRQVGNMNTPVHMQFQREWDYQITPLFQYAIFYDQSMELFPGAQFVVGGKVHSNGTIYTGTTASIAFNDKVTYVSGIQYNYSPNDPRTQGALNQPTFNAGPAAQTTTQTPPGDLSANTTDTNRNNDGPRELIEVPVTAQQDPNAGDRLYNKAGLKVLVNTGSSNITSDSGVAVNHGTQVYLTSDGTAIPSTDALASYLNTMITSGTTGNNTMNDYREGVTLSTTNVNVGNITTGYTAGGLPQTIPNTATWPNNSSVPAALKNQPISASIRGKPFWNGILYVSDISNSTTHRTGVKIMNGASLPDGSQTSSPTAGLSIATDNAAYIMGDYNTGGTPPVDSGTNLAANNYASSYTVQPAAVMADAITVVSANWQANGYDSKPTLSQRTPANTTINTALISGIVPSTKTGANPAYSGGVENYIRLLENWSNYRLTYYGSMVNLYSSQQSTAPWISTGTYYNAPVRNWYFDVNFLNPNRLPPGTPVIRSILRGQWAQIQQ